MSRYENFHTFFFLLYTIHDRNVQLQLETFSALNKILAHQASSILTMSKLYNFPIKNISLWNFGLCSKNSVVNRDKLFVQQYHSSTLNSLHSIPYNRLWKIIDKAASNPHVNAKIQCGLVESIIMWRLETHFGRI